MKRGIILVAILVMALMPIMASAEIYFEPMHSVYNLGDMINANVTLSSSIDRIDFLTVTLICGIKEVEAHKSIQSLTAGERKTVPIVAVIDENIVGNVLGECYLRALFGAGEVRSQPFTISNQIDVELKADTAVFNPGESIIVSGTALKRNREPLNGNVELSVQGSGGTQLKIADETILSEDVNETIRDTNETEEKLPSMENNVTMGSIISEVKDGQFTLTFRLPENSPPGTYNLNADVYDISKYGSKLNSGQGILGIRVRQIITDVDVALVSDKVIPGSNFDFTPLLYDQAKNIGSGEIAVNVYRPDKSLFQGKIMKSNEQTSIPIGANYTPGFWTIETKYNELSRSKVFFVEENKKISSTIESGVLTVTNEGNVPFKGPVEISIGGKTQVENLNLGLGSSEQFKLKAPDGEYEISLSDGLNTMPLGRSFLTGNVIGIGDVKGYFMQSVTVWAWSLLLIILLIIAVILVRRFLRRKYVGKPPKRLMISSRSSINGPYPKNQTYVAHSSTSMGSNINSGEKEEASLVVLKIKNYEKIKSRETPLGSIEKALLSAKAAKAKIYSDNEYRIIVFMPQFTKEKDNSLKAINTAKELESQLNFHNRSFSDKIEFGIGVHAGALAVETDNHGRLKFVSLDNTLAISKRIAERSNGICLLSDQMHKKALGKIKAEKTESGFWELKRTVGMANREEFINKFLDRQNNPNKKIFK